MYTNTPATLYNMHKSGAVTTYRRTVIKDVFWEQTETATVNRLGTQASNTVFIGVPKNASFDEKKYIAPKNWQKTPVEDTDKYFTFDKAAQRCYIVKGVCLFDGNNIADLLAQFDNVTSVLSVSDLTDIGGDDVQHWELGGK